MCVYSFTDLGEDNRDLWLGCIVHSTVNKVRNFHIEKKAVCSPIKSEYLGEQSRKRIDTFLCKEE